MTRPLLDRGAFVFVLVSPKGKIVKETVSLTKRECESCAFSYMADRLGNHWQSEFWKRWEAGQRDIRKRGYQIRKARLSVVLP